jgi:amidophosphoribosyltransferase
MYLLMEKQHNRGQDGAGFASIKLDVEPGERYITACDLITHNLFRTFFAQINDRINEEMALHPEYADDTGAKNKYSLH